MSKILVGTILANAEEPSRQWLALQLAALRATVDFEHVAVIPTGRYIKDMPTAVKYFSKHTTMLTNLQPGPMHVSGLLTIQKHFIERKSEFDGFLFLDSDAFPIRKGWHDILLSLMDGQRGRRNHIATVYRPECGDYRLHASVLYVIPRALEGLKFVLEKRASKFKGVERDTYIDPYEDNRRQVHILLRSNRVNIHPILAGAYGDLFYHHGCGSRNYHHRYGWWSKVVNESHFDLNISTTLREKLLSDPKEFLGQFLWDSSTCSMPRSIPSLDGP